ncbi:MAG: hypothetical protein ACREGJ_04390 [Candidatus Saccharimonadales bacterium]
MPNTIISTPEYEPQLPLEVERKFVPHGLNMDPWLEHARHIEQIYTSWPEEDWSLRVRKTKSAQQVKYEATLKSRPGTQGKALVRQEINTPISEAAYNFYAAQNLPRLQKLRATLTEGVTMDWLVHEAGTPQPFVLEVEGNNEEQLAFLDECEGRLSDVSRNREYDNEYRAHQLWATPQECPPAALNDRLIATLADKLNTAIATQQRPVIVGIKGRSGSGKSTFASTLAQQLDIVYGLKTMHLSTDDYHRGQRWLCDTHGVEKWQNWDSPAVYNTAALAFDLRQHLDSGQPIARRYFDFALQEPVVEATEHAAAPIIVIEGLFPHSPDLDGLVNHLVEVPTPLATSIGRRITRDMQSRLNSSLGGAEAILRYQMEIAEPTYQANNVQAKE